MVIIIRVLLLNGGYKMTVGRWSIIGIVLKKTRIYQKKEKLNLKSGSLLAN